MSKDLTKLLPRRMPTMQLRCIHTHTHMFRQTHTNKRTQGPNCVSDVFRRRWLPRYKSIQRTVFSHQPTNFMARVHLSLVNITAVQLKSKWNSPELPQLTWPARGRLPAGAVVPWRDGINPHCGEKLVCATITWRWGSLARPASLVSMLGLSLRFELRLMMRAPPWRRPPPSKHYHLSNTCGGKSSQKWLP